MKTIKTVPLNKKLENHLLQYMNQDRIGNFFAIFDLTNQREKTQFWVALSNNKIEGYLMEYDKRILHIRGRKECAAQLLRNTDLTPVLFNIEPQHLPAVKNQYEPTASTDETTIGLVTTYINMITTRETSTLIIRHRTQKLGIENAQALAELIGFDLQRALDLLKGVGYGIFKDNKLVSSAVSPEALEDLAIIRGVQTSPEERNKGYATSVCSKLVQELHQRGKDVVLYVSKDNPAAIKLYEKIGFKKTGHVFVSFIAKRK